MAGYKSYKSNYPYSKKYKSGLSKKSYGNFKAAAQTRDSMNFVIKCNYAFSALYDSGTKRGVAIIPIYEVLRRNSQFKSFAAIYDQIKVNGVRVKLNVVDAETTAANYGSVKTINIVTAWDRTGVSIDQVALEGKFTNGMGIEVQEELKPENYDNCQLKNFVTQIASGITQATGNNKTILNSFERWVSKPYLYASSAAEKGCYLSTSNFDQFVDSIDSNNAVYHIDDRYNEMSVNNILSSANPCIPFENPSIPWKPTLLVGVFKTGILNGEVSQYNDCPPVTFNGEFSIECTFRNMKAST